MSYNNDKIKIAIIGAGADGQGVASRYLNPVRRLPNSTVDKVAIWNHNPDRIGKIAALVSGNLTHPSYFWDKGDRSVLFNFNNEYARTHTLLSSPLEGQSIEDSLGEAIEDAKYIYISIPSATLRENFGNLAKVIQPGQRIMIRSKGAEYGEDEDYFLVRTPYQIAREELSGKEVPRFIEGGLNFSPEVIDNVFQYSMISTGMPKNKNQQEYKNKQEMISEASRDLSARGYSIIGTNNLVTPQIAWIFKNISAMAAGASAGYNSKYTDDPINYNTDSVRFNLVSSFMANLLPMVYEMGGNTNAWSRIPISVTDFLGTSTSEISRNFRAGLYKAQGMSLEDTLNKVNSTVEGITQLQKIHSIIEKRPDLDPAGIIKSTYDIFFKEANIAEIIHKISNLNQEQYRLNRRQNYAIEKKGPKQDTKGVSDVIKIPKKKPLFY